MLLSVMSQTFWKIEQYFQNFQMAVLRLVPLMHFVWLLDVCHRMIGAWY